MPSVTSIHFQTEKIFVKAIKIHPFSKFKLAFDYSSRIGRHVVCRFHNATTIGFSPFLDTIENINPR